MFTFDLHREKSRKMKARGKGVTGSEVRDFFKRPFTADLKSDGWKNEWAESREAGEWGRT